MSISRKIVSTSNGSNGSKGPFADDLFSSDLYRGNGVRTVIENGIQLGDTIDYNTNSLDLTGHNGRATGLNSSDLSLSGNFYISFWIKTQAYQSTTMILDGRTSIGGSQMVLYFEGSSLVISRGTGIVLYANTIHADHPNEWVHVVFSRIGSTLSSFVGGDRINTTQDSGSFSSSSNNFLNTFSGYNQPLRNCQFAELKLASSLPTGANPYDPTKETCIIPTGPEKVTIGTKILCFSGSDGSSSFLQNKVNQSTISVSASTTGESPFGDNLPVAVDGAGGMVWIKSRSIGQRHAIVDTGRGVENVLASDETGGNRLRDWVDFNDDGYTIRTGDTEMNTAGWDYAAWTFRKAPSFFDVVTYTGTGVAGNVEIPHNLAATPGMVIVKDASNTGAWYVWHRTFSNPLDDYLILNQTNQTGNSSGLWGTSGVTSTSFSVQGTGSMDTLNNEYVAYLFAHDPDEGMIQCGSFVPADTWGSVIDLGWEPQFLMIKNADGSGDWEMYDNMRGITTGGADPLLYPNKPDVEVDYVTNIDLHPNGFEQTFSSSNTEEFIYMAIRRPNKPASEFEPEELFTIDDAGNSTDPAFTSGFPVDMALRRNPSDGASNPVHTRLIAPGIMYTDLTNPVSIDSNSKFDYQDGWNSATNLSTMMSWMWRRAPGFFDVVAYTGDGSSSRVVPHNLGAKPEMIWMKVRSGSLPNDPWQVLVEGSIFPFDDSQGSSFDLDSRVTETTLTVNSGVGWLTRTNAGNNNYIAYLFASVAGISKVGSYTGTGQNQVIDCGFSAGARFLMIKRNDSSGGGWFVWDSGRGFESGQPINYLRLDSTINQQTGRWVYSNAPTGFGLNPMNSYVTEVNVLGHEYIYYAIA